MRQARSRSRESRLELADLRHSSGSWGTRCPGKPRPCAAMIDRLLDPEKESTLGSIATAAHAIGKRLHLALV